MKKITISALCLVSLFWSRALVADVGNYLDFDGSSDYINCSNPASLKISGDLTIEAWIYCESVTGDGNVIVSRAIESETEAGNILYQFRVLPDGTLRLMWESGAGTNQTVTTGTGVISNNTWHHVAAVREVGTTSKVWLFVDGVCKASATSVINPSGGTDTNQRVWIGANYQNDTYRYWFNGKIDEVRIWNVVRSTAQIQANMYGNLVGNESGLVGYWKFDENTGTAVYDATSNHNDGSISGASWVTGNITIGNDATFEVDITQDTYWRSDIINVRSNIWVLNGATLKIFPGATVSFSASNTRGLIVENGSLLSVGTADHPILFTPADKTSTKWYGIRFDSTPSTNATSRLEYCQVEYARGSLAAWIKWGGGVCIRDFSKVEIVNCIINNNSAYEKGGGIYCKNANITIENSIITNNISGGEYSYGCGHGIYLISSSPTITNCTICNNIAPHYTDQSGNGIFSDSYSSPNVKNCLLYWNSLAGLPQATSGTRISYSNVQYGFSGTGNISSDPKIVGSGDYRLQASSPCINAGDPATSGLPSTDLDGNPRIYDGLVDRIDIGAFEYQGDAAPITTPPPNSAVEPATEQIPTEFALSQNYPNPFNPETRIQYALKATVKVHLAVYDLMGRAVAVLFDGVQNAGNYEVTFSGIGLSSGVYFLKLQAGDNFSATKKMLLVH